VSAQDEETARAFKSALTAKNPAPIDVYTEHPRAYSQPGLEQRDTLKTTANQALRTDMYGTIMQRLVENSAVMAAGATVLTTATGEDLAVPKETAWVSSALTAEGASITESDPTLAFATLKAYKYASFFEISQELANDSPANLLDFLADLARSRWRWLMGRT
jgi:HK97 family phage major capsid protein